MKKMLLAIAIAASLCACATTAGHELVATDRRGDVVRVSDRPCAIAEILSVTPPQYRERLRDASATVGGQRYRACWFVDGDSAHLVYEDGDEGMVPLAAFKKDAGA
jgi:hypothetical protein